MESIRKDIGDSKILAWSMWGIVCLYYFYQFFMRVAPTVIDEELMRYFSLTATSFGTLCGYYYFTYTPLQVPAGLLLDKYGPKLVSCVSCILCGIGAWMFVAKPSYELALIGRALTGIGSAAAFVATMKIGLNWFDKSYVALINTLTIAFGTLGACAGAPLFAHLKQSFDWRDLIIVLAGFGLLLAVFIYCFVKDSPKRVTKGLESKTNKLGLWAGLKTVMTNRQCWVASFYIMLIYAPLSGFADMWGVPFLKRAYDLSTVAASSASNMLYVGMIVGGPTYAWFSNFMENRKICLWSGTLIGAAAFGIVILFPGSINYFCLSACLLIAGIGLSGGFLIYTLVVEVMPSSLSGTIIAFINMFSMISGVILQPLLGWILNITWDGSMCDGVPFYSISSYQITMGIIVLCLIISIFHIPFLKESFPEQLKKGK